MSDAIKTRSDLSFRSVCAQTVMDPFDVSASDYNHCHACISTGSAVQTQTVNSHRIRTWERPEDYPDPVSSLHVIIPIILSTMILEQAVTHTEEIPGVEVIEVAVEMVKVGEGVITLTMILAPSFCSSLRGQQR